MMEIQRKRKIVIGTRKGGSGKSFLVCFLTEKFNFLNIPIELTDVDPNQISQKWADKLFKLGRQVSTYKGSQYEIVDTGGTVGSFAPHLKDADDIIVPVQLYRIDIDLFKEWFEDKLIGHESKVVIVPNRWQGTVKQKEYLEELQLFAKKHGCQISTVIHHRPTFYEDFMDGKLKFNFFSLKKIPQDLNDVVDYLINLIRKEK